MYDSYFLFVQVAESDKATIETTLKEQISAKELECNELNATLVQLKSQIQVRTPLCLREKALPSSYSLTTFLSNYYSVLIDYSVCTTPVCGEYKRGAGGRFKERIGVQSKSAKSIGSSKG